MFTYWWHWASVPLPRPSEPCMPQVKGFWCATEEAGSTLGRSLGRCFWEVIFAGAVAISQSRWGSSNQSINQSTNQKEVGQTGDLGVPADQCRVKDRDGDVAQLAKCRGRRAADWGGVESPVQQGIFLPQSAFSLAPVPSCFASFLARGSCCCCAA